MSNPDSTAPSNVRFNIISFRFCSNMGKVQIPHPSFENPHMVFFWNDAGEKRAGGEKHHIQGVYRSLQVHHMWLHSDV